MVLRPGQIQHGDRAGAHIRGVTPLSVAGDDQHVRFLRPGGHRAHDLERLGVDNRHRLVQLRGHVEHAARPIVDRAVGPHSVPKVHLARDLPAGNVNHHHFVAVGSRLAYSGAAVNRYICGAAIWGGSHLVPGDTSLGNGCQLLRRRGVDDAKVTITLVRGNQHRLYRRVGDSGSIHQQEAHRKDEAEPGKYVQDGSLIHVHGARIISASATLRRRVQE